MDLVYSLNGLNQEKAGVEPAERGTLFTPALGRKPEEVVTSDLVAGGFPTDMGEGVVNPIFPLVAAFEYIYPRRQLTRMQHVYP